MYFSLVEVVLGHRHMENQIWHPLEHSSLRYTRSETLQPTRLGIFQVLWPECEEGHTGELCLAPFGESHLRKHTSTHILGPLASFGGIPVLRGSFPPKTAVGGPRVVYPPRFLRARFHQCTFS